jgi:TonB family protein
MPIAGCITFGVIAFSRRNIPGSALVGSRFTDKEVLIMFSQVLKVSALTAVVALATVANAAEAPATYTKSVMEQVSKQVEYPKMAKMRHQEGAALIAISMGANGTPTSATIEKSSGFQSLDDAALNAVKAAAPYPAPTEAGAVVHGSIRFAAE